jgi:TatA/E family protein of Tat protein translocase
MPTPGPLELVIILVIALLILGPGKLPEVGSALGKSIREFRKASSDVQEAVTVNVDTSPLPPTPASTGQTASAGQTVPASQVPPVAPVPGAPAVPVAPVAPIAAVEDTPPADETTGEPARPAATTPDSTTVAS